MKWEDFTQVKKQRRFRTDQIEVRVLECGDIYLNQLAYDALDRPRAVILSFDRRRRAIGLKPSTPEVGHAFSVSKRNPKQHSYRVLGKTFCAQYGVEHTETQVLIPTVIRGMLVIHLKPLTHNAPASYDFEEFIEKGKRYTTEVPRITLLKDRTISFNRAVYEALGRPQAILSSYSPEYHAMRLESASTDERGSSRVSEVSQSQRQLHGWKEHTFRASVRMVLSEHNINIFYSKTFRPELQQGSIFFELAKGSINTPRNAVYSKTDQVIRVPDLAGMLERAVKALLSHHKKTKEAPPLEILAERLGISRPSLSSLLKQFLMNYKQLYYYCLSSGNPLPVKEGGSRFVLEDFKPASGFNTRPTSRLIVTLARSGKLYLNRAAHDALGRPNALTYFYDEQHKAIGLKSARTKTAYAYVLSRVNAKAYVYEAHAKRFLDHYGVEHSNRRDIEAVVIDGMLVVNFEMHGESERYNFELYRKVEKPFAGKVPRITLLKQGLLTFNQAVCTALGRSEAVTVSHDTRRNTLELKPSEAKSGYYVRRVIKRMAGAKPTSESGKQGNFRVSIKRLLADWEVNVTQSKAFPAQVRKNTAWVNLAEGAPVGWHESRISGAMKKPSHRGGFDLEQTVREYKEHITVHGKPPSAESLAQKLHISRQGLYDGLKRHGMKYRGLSSYLFIIHKQVR